jgi:hypothetical protein
MSQSSRTGIYAIGRAQQLPFFSYRIWYGMRVSAWLSLLARNRFAVSPNRIIFCLRGCICSLVNSSLNIVQRLIFGKRIRNCVLDAPPIFIIGHWRTGTTLLHELLTLDQRFIAPTTMECFAPAVCLVFGRVLRWLRFMLHGQSTHGQHAGRLGSPAGGRVRADESGSGLTL